MGQGDQEVTARVTVQVIAEVTLKLGVGGLWATEIQCLQQQPLSAQAPTGPP